MSNQQQVLKGLAELAVLSALDEGPRYGLDILDRLRNEAGLDVAEGSIYPILHRLERAGTVTAEWRIDTDGGRPRKYYELTKAGRSELKTSVEAWQRISRGLSNFLGRKRKS